jgi:hypothetical protein
MFYSQENCIDVLIPFDWWNKLHLAQKLNEIENI